MKKIVDKFLNIFEIIIPSIFVSLLLFTFMIGIISRYILKNPQTWTYEVETVSFYMFSMLSVCLVNREDGHIVFDLFYNKSSKKTQIIFRIISNLLIIIFSIILIPYTMKFIWSMNKLYLQFMNIPRYIPFISFLIVLISTIMYCLIYLYKDIKTAKGIVSSNIKENIR